jgi:hypothetical protein
MRSAQIAPIGLVFRAPLRVGRGCCGRLGGVIGKANDEVTWISLVLDRSTLHTSDDDDDGKPEFFLGLWHPWSAETMRPSKNSRQDARSSTSSWRQLHPRSARGLGEEDLVSLGTHSPRQAKLRPGETTISGGLECCKKKK